MFAIIGGSGLARLAALDQPERRLVRTPYGEPSGALTFGRIAGHEVVFLARHGYGHTIAPHDINYRANIWALREIGVEGVFAIASVGAVRGDLSPHDLVIPHQILDYTHSRHASFHEPGQPFTHIDFTHPYSAELRARLVRAAATAGEAIVDGAVYACTQGPRLETAAEIDRIERDGGDIVGMTGMPEAALAREAGLAYATLAMVVNPAAGRGSSTDRIEMARIEDVLHDCVARAVRVLECAVSEGAGEPRQGAR